MATVPFYPEMAAKGCARKALAEVPFLEGP
jgi:hypothetical protein